MGEDEDKAEPEDMHMEDDETDDSEMWRRMKMRLSLRISTWRI